MWLACGQAFLTSFSSSMQPGRNCCRGPEIVQRTFPEPHARRRPTTNCAALHLGRRRPSIHRPMANHGHQASVYTLTGGQLSSEYTCIHILNHLAMLHHPLSLHSSFGSKHGGCCARSLAARLCHFDHSQKAKSGLGNVSCRASSLPRWCVTKEIGMPSPSSLPSSTSSVSQISYPIANSICPAKDSSLLKAYCLCASRRSSTK